MNNSPKMSQLLAEYEELMNKNSSIDSKSLKNKVSYEAMRQQKGKVKRSRGAAEPLSESTANVSCDYGASDLSNLAPLPVRHVPVSHTSTTTTASPTTDTKSVDSAHPESPVDSPSSSVNIWSIRKARENSCESGKPRNQGFIRNQTPHQPTMALGRSAVRPTGILNRVHPPHTEANLMQKQSTFECLDGVKHPTDSTVFDQTEMDQSHETSGFMTTPYTWARNSRGSRLCQSSYHDESSYNADMSGSFQTQTIVEETNEIGDDESQDGIDPMGCESMDEYQVPYTSTAPSIVDCDEFDGKYSGCDSGRLGRKTSPRLASRAPLSDSDESAYSSQGISSKFLDYEPTSSMPKPLSSMDHPISSMVPPASAIPHPTSFMARPTSSMAHATSSTAPATSMMVYPTSSKVHPTSSMVQPGYSHSQSGPYSSSVQVLNQALPQIDLNRREPMQFLCRPDNFHSDAKYVGVKSMGKGGSSEVFMCFNREVGLVAVKVVDLSDADELSAAGYRNEVKLLESLQEKNSDSIVKLIEFQESPREQLLYIVLECGETDFSTILKESFRIQPDKVHYSPEELNRHWIQVMYFWIQMLEAVKVIHDAGLVHADLKPANFILVKSKLKLIDFGISNVIPSNKTSITQAGHIGTLNYMSPEAIDSGTSEEDEMKCRISPRSDVWSLGCILYYMVYGRLPYQNIKGILLKMTAIGNRSKEVQFPSSPHKDLVDVMKQCLVKDPKSRATVDELISAALRSRDGGRRIGD